MPGTLEIVSVPDLPPKSQGRRQSEQIPQGDIHGPKVVKGLQIPDSGISHADIRRGNNDPCRSELSLILL